MSFEIDEDFECFLERFGVPNKYSAVDDSTITRHEGSVPNRLLEYWQEFGFCSFSDGLFWITNPDEYRYAVKTWFIGAQFDVNNIDDYVVIARSGFGDLFLWNKEQGYGVVIEPRDSCIFLKEGYDKKIQSGQEDEEIKIFIGTRTTRITDLEDVDTDKAIFADAVKKFGPLAPDEMFTFEPALFLGGVQTLKSVNKVNIHIQLDLLASMGTPEIMDIHGLTKKAFS